MPIAWNRLPPLTALRAFQAVAEMQGLSAAARALNVTHAAPGAVHQRQAQMRLKRPNLLRHSGMGHVQGAGGRA